MRNTKRLIDIQQTKQKKARLQLVKKVDSNEKFCAKNLKANHKYFVHSLFCEMFDKI